MQGKFCAYFFSRLEHLVDKTKFLFSYVAGEGHVQIQNYITKHIQKIVLRSGQLYSDHKTLYQELRLRLFYEEKDFTRLVPVS